MTHPNFTGLKFETEGHTTTYSSHQLTEIESWCVRPVITQISATSSASQITWVSDLAREGGGWNSG